MAAYPKLAGERRIMSHEAPSDLQDRSTHEPEAVVADPASDAGDSDLPAADDALVEEELLVEEVSIDGMCGVY